MNDRKPATTPPAIRGSWEDLLAQAQQKAANFNDEAIPLFEKVFNGLGRLPESKRKAGEGRLQAIFISSALALQGYLNLRDRYDESLAVLAQAKELVDPDERDQWESQIADVLIQAGRPDEGIARLQDLARQPDAKLGDWGRLVLALIRVGRPHIALQVLDELDGVLAAGSLSTESGSDANADINSDAAYVAGLRAIVAIESENWDEGIAAFDDVLAQGGAYAQNPHLIYGRLINAGRHEDALPLLNRDQNNPVRSGFWRGLSLFKQGRTDEAKRAWQRVTQIKADQHEQRSLVEYALSHFYLGDKDGAALGSLLGIIREQRQRVPWALFLLVGLGWTLRPDMDAARSNLEIAVAQRKSAAEGRLLPYQYWQMVEGLLSEEAKAQISEYFELERSPAGSAS